MCIRDRQQTVGLQSYSVIEEKEFEQLCDELWGKAATTVVDRSVGKGRIFWETSLNLEQVLEKIQLRPDFEVITDSISAPIRYIHRQIGCLLYTSTGGNSFSVYRKKSFIRLDNRSVGYNVPSRWITKLGLGSLRVYANVEM